MKDNTFLMILSVSFLIVTLNNLFVDSRVWQLENSVQSLKHEFSIIQLFLPEKY